MPPAMDCTATPNRHVIRTFAPVVAALLALTGCREAPPHANPAVNREFPLSEFAQELMRDVPGSHWSGTWYQQPSTMGQRVRITHLGNGEHVVEHYGNVLDPQTLSGDALQIASVEAGDRKRFRLIIDDPESRCARAEQLQSSGAIARARLCRE